MQNKLFIFKLKSLKHPNIKWDNVSHFLYTNEDRELTKKKNQILLKQIGIKNMLNAMDVFLITYMTINCTRFNRTHKNYMIRQSMVTLYLIKKKVYGNTQNFSALRSVLNLHRL